MSMFKKGEKKEMPAIASGSLSDIVFMLLFFFMVTTQMRETENKVVVKIPQASESVKLERKDLASYINIGTPIRSLQAQYGTDARIQLNDSFKTVDDIRDFVAARSTLGICQDDYFVHFGDIFIARSAFVFVVSKLSKCLFCLFINSCITCG